MRALWLTNLWPDESRPGEGSFIYSQAQSLIEAGVEIDVQYVQGYQSRAAYFRAVPELRRRVSRNEYDVVHAHFGYAGAIGTTQRKVPLVISYLGADLLGQPGADGSPTRESRLLAQASRQTARLAQATITKSLQMQQQLPRACHARNHVIPNGVNLEVFRPLDREAALKKLGWRDDEWNVLFIGNPELPRKNLAFARATCEELERRGHRIALRPAYGRPFSDVPVLMSAATCLLFPSLSEGSPNAVKEALATELPVVSTRVGDTPERLTGIRGCSLIGLDVHEAADAVERAAAAGRIPEGRRSVEPLAIEAVAEQVKSVYREALARRPRRS